MDRALVCSRPGGVLLLWVVLAGGGCGGSFEGGSGSRAAGGSQAAFDNPMAATSSSPARPAAGAAGGAAKPDGDGCNQVELEFAPRIPSVFILVDRSSSMFDNGLWEPLKQGVLAVVSALEGAVRFGFSSYTGAQGMQCPELTAVAPLAQGNSAAIARAYDAISKPQYKGETPTSLAVSEVARMLRSADDPKYILLVTDGEPDFCDDGNLTCARDAVVAAVQSAYAQGIGTLIFSIGGQVDQAHLADVANAGTGQPVADRQLAVQNQCPNSAAIYAASGGRAPYFEPDVNDRAALVSALSGALAAVRSCVFDLQGKLRIQLSLADQGVVELDGTRLAFDSPDGFRLNSETQLELLGSACDRLRQPDAKRLFIDFPCHAIELL